MIINFYPTHIELQACHSHYIVIPAEAGIHNCTDNLDSGCKFLMPEWR
jgi:hypothetical protein